LSLARDLGIPQSHETQIHNIASESEIIMIGVLNHQTRIHNITVESVSIMVGLLLREKKSNERAAYHLLILMVDMTLTIFVNRD